MVGLVPTFPPPPTKYDVQFIRRPSGNSVSGKELTGPLIEGNRFR